MSTQTNCLFCKMSQGIIPVEKLYEDDKIFVIKDIKPKAQVHLLVIAHQHIDNLFATQKNDEALLGYMLNTLKTIAKSQGLETGFRTIINSGALSGQEIDHLHIHLLGGQKLPGF